MEAGLSGRILCNSLWCPVPLGCLFRLDTWRDGACAVPYRLHSEGIMNNQRQTDVNTDDLYSVRMPTSARRWQTDQGNSLVPAGLQPGQVFTGADGVQYVVMPGKRPASIPPRAS